jgi:cholesterol oxidase
MLGLSSNIQQMKAHYTVVVIGSGYGGGISASRLARAGQSVCVLERGKEVRPGSYPVTEPEALEQMQFDTPLGHAGNLTGLFDFRINREISALVGCGLGGTSLINANVGMEPTPGVFDDPRWPEELRRPGALDWGYARAREMLAPTPFPQHLPAPATLTQLESSAASIPGATFARTPIYVTFDEPPAGVNRFGTTQHACTQCGNCVSGCNYSAKNTVLMNYLPDAKNHGAEIFCEVSVTRVSRSGGQWLVHYYPTGSQEHLLQVAERTLSADLVILASGTLGSTEILLRSVQAGLSTSSLLGKHFSSNGDLLGFAYNGSFLINSIGSQPPRTPATGPCITGIIDTRSKDGLNGFVMENAVTPSGITAGLPEALALAAHFGVETSKNNEPEQLLRTLESVLKGPYFGATRNTQTLLGLGYDSATGTMALQDNRLRISWPGIGEEPTFDAESNGFEAVTASLEGIYIREPIWTPKLGDALLTVHPLGGCVMGESAELGVVDHKGRVFSDSQGKAVHDGLYVSDGAVVPMSLAINPSLTICALAERCATLIAADHGWTIDYAFNAESAASS